MFVHLLCLHGFTNSLTIFPVLDPPLTYHQLAQQPSTSLTSIPSNSSLSISISLTAEPESTLVSHAEMCPGVGAATPSSKRRRASSVDKSGSLTVGKKPVFSLSTTSKRSITGICCDRSE